MHVLTNGHANGIERQANAGLKITIVGAGIGGLSAAIFLRQQGHIVTVLEQSRFANEVGAALHIAPNAHGLLKRMGIHPEKTANLMESVRTVFCSLLGIALTDSTDDRVRQRVQASEARRTQGAQQDVAAHMDSDPSGSSAR
jgi:2-polyprenyl-6-methoxyphenol hydroxylase-like FAD-dependent oxidoreductase